MRIYHEQLPKLKRHLNHNATGSPSTKGLDLWTQALSRLTPSKDSIYFTHLIGTVNYHDPAPRKKRTYTRAIFPDGLVITAIGHHRHTLQHSWHIFHRKDFLLSEPKFATMPLGDFKDFPHEEILAWEAWRGTPVLQDDLQVSKLEGAFHELEAQGLHKALPHRRQRILEEVSL